MPIYLNMIRVVVVVVMALLYAFFDVFNRREIPEYFRLRDDCDCGTFRAELYGADAFELFAFVSAIAIAAVGYLLYRSGFLGGGDIFIAVAITLISIATSSAFGQRDATVATVHHFRIHSDRIRLAHRRRDLLSGVCKAQPAQRKTQDGKKKVGAGPWGIGAIRSNRCIIFCISLSG